MCADCGVDTVGLQNRLVDDVWGWRRQMSFLGFDPGRSLWEVDHILPLSAGGSNLMGNVQTLCQPCHTIKTRAENRVRDGGGACL